MQAEIKKFIADFIAENKEQFHTLSRQIWENPELGMEEFRACALHVKMLQENGFETETEVACMPTAFVGTYGSGKPVIGFSVEYDALPGLSQKVLDHKEPVVESAPGHGCGHNLLGTGALMAATALKEAMRKYGLPGTIKVFGTPAEELCIGKPVMGNSGIFDGIDILLDWHPSEESGAEYVTCPAYFNIRYHYKGQTAHGNAPWYGRSALDAAILQGHAIEMLREHIEPSQTSAAHTINYTFSDTGPEFASVVPDRATLWCIGRFTTSEQVSDVISRIDRCAEGAALATGTSVEKEYITASHELIPNKTVSQTIYNNLLEIGSVRFTEEEKHFVHNMQKEEGQETFWSETIRPFGGGSMGVIDSSEYSWAAPYGILTLALGPGPGWHNWMITACSGGSHGQKVMNKAAQILAASAVDFVLDENLIKAARAEWKERMGGRKYKSLLPAGTPVPLSINKKVMNKYR